MSDPADTGDLAAFAHDTLLAQLDQELTDSFVELSGEPHHLAPPLARAFVEKHILFLLIAHADTPKKRAALSAWREWRDEMSAAAFNHGGR